MNIDLQAKEIKPLRQTFDRVKAYTGDKAPSRYQEATLGAQPTENFHYRPTWEPAMEIFDVRRTAIVLDDWNALRDPRQYYYATWTMARARQQESMDANYQFVESRGLIDKMPEPLRNDVAAVLMPLRHAAWGANMNNCSMASRGYGAVFTAPALMHAMDHLGAAQFLTRLGLLLGDSACLDDGKSAWLSDPAWQPLRQLQEDSFIEQDPIALFVRQNLAIDGLLYPLLYGQYVEEYVALRGGSAVAMLTVFMPEWHKESARWVDGVLKVIAAASDANRARLQGWIDADLARAHAALAPVAARAMPETHAEALAAARAELDARLAKLGLAGR